MINAWIKGNNKKRQYNVRNMKFPEKRFYAIPKKKKFSDVSCTHRRTCVYGRYAPENVGVSLPFAVIM